MKLVKAVAESMGYLQKDDTSAEVNALQVIAIGMPRTGTTTLTMALDILEYKPYHQGAAFTNAEKMKSWNTIVSTKWSLRQKYGPDISKWYSDQHLINPNNIDFHNIYYQYGYNAAVCLPTYLIYKEILQKYPKMKVILTQRESEKWYQSMLSTINKIRALEDRWLPSLIFGSKLTSFQDDAFLELMFDGKLSTDKEFVIKQYNDWNKMVKSTVPKDQLLIFHPKQGWEPLCEFLGKPIPNVPFPRSNSKQNIRKGLAIANGIFDVINLSIFGGIAYFMYYTASQGYNDKSYEILNDLLNWI